MKCPSCGSELISLDDKPPRGCPCGWRRGRLVDPRRDFQHSPADAMLLVFFWIVSLAIAVGSYWYCARRWGAASHWQLWFFGAWAAYIGICYQFRQPTHECLSFWDFVWDNPFTLDDDINRVRFFVDIVMIPGKIILHTIYSTFVLIQRS